MDRGAWWAIIHRVGRKELDITEELDTAAATYHAPVMEAAL